MTQTVTPQTAELQAFRQRFPLSFDLWDREEQPILSCMSSVGQTLLLRLNNEGQSPLNLLPVNGDEYHFILYFRKGTLQDLAAIRLEGPTGWELVARPAHEPQIDALLLRGAAGDSLPAQETRTLLLHGVRSEGSRGTRNTRVALSYHRLAQDGRPLDVVHQHPPETRGERGARRRPLPLRVGFAAANTVLVNVAPDAEKNSVVSALHLQISSLVSTPILFRRDAANDDRSSRFILDIEVQDEEEERAWALGTLSEVSAIEPHLPGWQPVRYMDAERVVWVFTPQKHEIRLEPGKALNLTVNNIETTLPPGPANLYLHVENVPDPHGEFYADQQHTLTVQKRSFLLVSAGAAIGPTFAGAQVAPGSVIVEERVGIGLTSPQGRLELGSEAQAAEEPAIRVRFGDTAGKAVHHLVSSRDTVFNSVAGEWRFRQIDDYDNIYDFSDQAKITQGRFHDKYGPVVPVGALIPWGGLDPPEGWLYCHGQELSVAQYPELFSVISYYYGGSNDIFRVPSVYFNLDGSASPRQLHYIMKY